MNLLEKLPIEKLFYVEHGTRHPASIYLLSLEKLGKAFKRSIDDYERLTFEHLIQTSNDLKIDDLLESQEHLLRAQQEHLEDCFLILKTLVDPSTAKQSPRFSEQYVTENKLPGVKTFVNAVLDHKARLQIANKLKHQQGRLRGIAIRPYGRLHLGYFLEEPIDKGVIGASKEIHPDQGAFSFARDLSLRFYDAYYCAEKLCNAIRAAFSGLHGISINESHSQHPSLWKELVQSFARMEENIFPKESGKFMPKFVISKSTDSLSILSGHPANLQFQSSLPTIVSTVPDRYSNSFRLPIP